MNLRPILTLLLVALVTSVPAIHALADEPAAATEQATDTSDNGADENASESSAAATSDSAASDDSTANDSDDQLMLVEEVAEEAETEEPAEEGPNAGMADLDKATQLKITAENLPDLNDVIDKIDSALEKGLDEQNEAFANELLLSTLLQRATILSAALLDRPDVDPRRDVRVMQVRQFAINDLVRIFELNPQIWESHLLMGRLQVLPGGDPKMAKREFTKVIDSDEATPEDKAQAHAIRGTLQTDTKKQAADFNAAIELVNYKPDYYRVRAQYYSNQNEFEKALADLDKALELAPDQASTQELRGLVLTGLKRFDDAREAFEKASELAPEAARPHQHLSELYRQQGDLDKSIEQLTKALEVQPDQPATLLLRANLYYQKKNFDAALADIDAAIQANPQLLVGHLLKAEILVAEDRIGEAIANLEKLVPLAPQQPRLLEPLATFYLVGGQPRKSIEMFGKIIELEPENFRALRFRGDANLNIGEHVAAVADFDAAYKLNQEDEGLLNNFAWVLATSPDDKVRDGKRAIELATKAAELSSYSVPHILSTLAAAYAETGDFENAKKWSQQAIDAGQADVEAAQDSEARTKAQASLDALKKELASYEAGKPIRERQQQDEGEAAPSASDQTSTPAEEKEAANKLEL